jgi:Ras family protein
MNEKSFQTMTIDKRVQNTSTSTVIQDSMYQRIKKRKLIVLGKMTVGKTSLINRFVDNTINERPNILQEEMYYKNYFYKNEELKLSILDTVGQSEFTPGLPQRYCIGVHGYILTFALDDNDSFEVIQHVNKILLESIGTKYIPRILVGNKKDLEGARYISTNQGKYQ